MTKMYKDTTHIFNGKDKPMQTGLKEIRDVLRGNQIVPPFMCWMHTWSHPDCHMSCLLYTSPSPRDATLSRMPSSA